MQRMTSAKKAIGVCLCVFFCMQKSNFMVTPEIQCDQMNRFVCFVNNGTAFSLCCQIHRWQWDRKRKVEREHRCDISFWTSKLMYSSSTSLDRRNFQTLFSKCQSAPTQICWRFGYEKGRIEHNSIAVSITGFHILLLSFLAQAES